MKESNPSPLNQVADYYSKKIDQHGTTPLGVDWNGIAGQNLRFEQLSKIIDSSCDFSIADLGCGYGAYANYLKEHYPSFTYRGIDISKKMILAANQIYKEQKNIEFITSDKPDSKTDYVIASGIFNVRLETPIDVWVSYIESTIHTLDHSCTKGFSFNCLTTFSDSDKMQKKLYYANPCTLFELCKKLYSRNVALLHDYDLYEFTILVRKKHG